MTIGQGTGIKCPTDMEISRNCNTNDCGDITAPEVTPSSLIPSIGSVGVSINLNQLKFKFAEHTTANIPLFRNMIEKVGIAGGIITILDFDTDTVVMHIDPLVDVEVDADELSMTAVMPSHRRRALSNNHRYYVNISPGAFRDKGGSPQNPHLGVSGKVWWFRTAASNAPVPIKCVPSDDSQYVRANTRTFKITFNDTIHYPGIIHPAAAGLDKHFKIKKIGTWTHAPCGNGARVKQLYHTCVNPVDSLSGSSRRLLGHDDGDVNPSSHGRTLEGVSRRVIAVTEHATCNSKTDLVILLDGSLNVHAAQFEKMRTQIGEIVTKMDMSSGQVKVALMVYGNKNCQSNAVCRDKCLTEWQANGFASLTSAQYHCNSRSTSDTYWPFTFDEYQTGATAGGAIKSIGSIFSDGRNTVDAMDQAQAMLKNTALGARPVDSGVSKVMLVVTGGQARDCATSGCSGVSAPLTADGITVITVGVGDLMPTSPPFLSELEGISTSSSNAFTATYSNIQRISDDVRARICDSNAPVEPCGGTVTGSCNDGETHYYSYSMNETMFGDDSIRYLNTKLELTQGSTDTYFSWTVDPSVSNYFKVSNQRFSIAGSSYKLETYSNGEERCRNVRTNQDAARENCGQGTPNPVVSENHGFTPGFSKLYVAVTCRKADTWFSMASTCNFVNQTAPAPASAPVNVQSVVLNRIANPDDGPGNVPVSEAESCEPLETAIDCKLLTEKCAKMVSIETENAFHNGQPSSYLNNTMVVTVDLATWGLDGQGIYQMEVDGGYVVTNDDNVEAATAQCSFETVDNTPPLLIATSPGPVLPTLPDVIHFGTDGSGSAPQETIAASANGRQRLDRILAAQNSISGNRPAAASRAQSEMASLLQNMVPQVNYPLSSGGTTGNTGSGGRRLLAVDLLTGVDSDYIGDGLALTLALTLALNLALTLALAVALILTLTPTLIGLFRSY